LTPQFAVVDHGRMSHVEPERDAQVQVLRVVVRDVSPLIMRRVIVDVNTTLAALDDVLRSAFGWPRDTHGRFRVHGCWFGSSSPAGDDRGTTLDVFGLRVGERFVYRHDAAGSWVHDIRVEAVRRHATRETVPRCVGGRRAVPPAWCRDALAFMAWEDTYTPVGVTDTVDPLADAGVLGVGEHVEMMAWWVRDVFDRRAVNCRLAGLAGAEVVT
jgi:Plasmid pRiA4b ORF-3-like protein